MSPFSVPLFFTDDDDDCRKGSERVVEVGRRIGYENLSEDDIRIIHYVGKIVAIRAAVLTSTREFGLFFAFSHSSCLSLCLPASYLKSRGREGEEEEHKCTLIDLITVQPHMRGRKGCERAFLLLTDVDKQTDGSPPHLLHVAYGLHFDWQFISFLLLFPGHLCRTSHHSSSCTHPLSSLLLLSLLQPPHNTHDDDGQSCRR